MGKQLRRVAAVPAVRRGVSTHAAGRFAPREHAGVPPVESGIPREAFRNGDARELSFGTGTSAVTLRVVVFKFEKEFFIFVSVKELYGTLPASLVVERSLLSCE